MGFNVAIDGPSGAGKSTIAKRVAKEMGYIYVDTGAMYRALAVFFIKNEVSPEQKEEILSACKKAEVSISYLNSMQQVFLNGENVTDMLREETVGNMASKTSVIPEVRDKLLELQRELAKKSDVVMDGRDIGTNILPDADVKIYLTASVDTRANRRYQELREKNEDCALEKIKKDIQERDERDMSRSVAPLKRAEDAVYIDSSELTIEQVVTAILEECKKKKV